MKTEVKVDLLDDLAIEELETRLEMELDCVTTYDQNGVPTTTCGPAIRY